MRHDMQDTGRRLYLIIALIPKAKTNEAVVMTVGISLKRVTKKGIISPSRIPRIPPAKVKIKVSERNCTIISLFLAPSARRIPISRVRSLTVASIIFIIPIPPTRSEIAAMEPRTILKIR